MVHVQVYDSPVFAESRTSGNELQFNISASCNSDHGFIYIYIYLRVCRYVCLKWIGSEDFGPILSNFFKDLLRHLNSNRICNIWIFCMYIACVFWHEFVSVVYAFVHCTTSYKLRQTHVKHTQKHVIYIFVCIRFCLCVYVHICI